MGMGWGQKIKCMSLVRDLLTFNGNSRETMYNERSPPVQMHMVLEKNSQHLLDSALQFYQVVG